MSKVYITQEPKQNAAGWAPNLAPAAQYGGLHYIFGKNEHPFMDVDAAVEKAKNDLRNFDESEDYLCWPATGDPAALWISIMVLQEMGCASITYLYWNRERDEDKNVLKGKGHYQPLTISVTEIVPDFNR